MAIAAVRRRRYVAALLRREPGLFGLGAKDISSAGRLFMVSLSVERPLARSTVPTNNNEEVPFLMP
ncbi:unannotated protein [freshwater metagenome]|uniref:Unannotated protein n=1 Tax=freshwater metagenome TaxID=449393 RepID=A0A6J6Q4V9_9ZZZZ